MELAVNKAEHLKAIEMRIKVDMSCAYEKIVDVGRCLVEAKNAKLVPHGHWGEWVCEVCGMSERQAQRWMQIAEQVPEGSYLSRLDITRMREILTLPEAEREDMARAALDEGLSSRKLQEKIDELKRAKADVEADAMRTRNELQYEINEGQEQLRRAMGELESAKEFVAGKEKRISELESQLENAKTATADAGISAQAQAEIDRLNRELEDANAFGDIQARKRKEAQEELMRLKQEARDGVKSAGEFSPEDLQLAVNQFMMAAAAIPHMGSEFSEMPESVRRAFEVQVAVVGEWLKGAHRALHTVAGELV